MWFSLNNYGDQRRQKMIFWLFSLGAVLITGLVFFGIFYLKKPKKGNFLVNKTDLIESSKRLQTICKAFDELSSEQPLTQALEAELIALFADGKRGQASVWPALLLAKSKCDVQFEKAQGSVSGLKQGIAWLEKAKNCNTNPGLADVINLRLAKLLLEQKEVGKAKAILQEMETPFGKSEAYESLGDIYMQEKDFLSAKSSYTSSLEHLEQFSQFFETWKHPLEMMKNSEASEAFIGIRQKQEVIRKKIEAIAHAIKLNSTQA